MQLELQGERCSATLSPPPRSPRPDSFLGHQHRLPYKQPCTGTEGVSVDDTLS